MPGENGRESAVYTPQMRTLKPVLAQQIQRRSFFNRLPDGSDSVVSQYRSVLSC